MVRGVPDDDGSPADVVAVKDLQHGKEGGSNDLCCTRQSRYFFSDIPMVSNHTGGEDSI